MFDCRGENSVGLVSFGAEWLQLTTSRAVGGEVFKVKVKTIKNKIKYIITGHTGR